MHRNVKFTNLAEDLHFSVTNENSQTSCKLITIHKDHFSSSTTYSQTWQKYITRLLSRIADLTQCTNEWLNLEQGFAVLCKEGTFFLFHSLLNKYHLLPFEIVYY